MPPGRFLLPRPLLSGNSGERQRPRFAAATIRPTWARLIAIVSYLERIQTLEGREAEIEGRFEAETRAYESRIRQELQTAMEAELAALSSAQNGEESEEDIRERYTEELQERLNAFYEEQEARREEEVTLLTRERDEAARLLDEENRYREQLVQELDELTAAGAGDALQGTATDPNVPVADSAIVEALRTTVRRLEAELRAYRHGSIEAQPETATQISRGPEDETASIQASATAAGRRRALSEVVSLIEAMEAARRGNAGAGGSAVAGDVALSEVERAVEDLLALYTTIERREYRRIGSVSLASGGAISAEIIGSTKPAIGSVVEIRRGVDGSRETRIAKGRVSDVSGERFVIEVTATLEPGSSPMVLDTVYLEE